MSDDSMIEQSQRDLIEWDNNADHYIGSGDDEDPMFAQFRDELWQSLGDLNGLEVLDLGCGEGSFCRAMRDAGAEVHGVDGSEKLLDVARSRSPGIPYLQANLALGLPTMDREFDRIVSIMVLMDIPILDHLIRDVGAALASGGKFIFIILHPCFFRYRVHQDEETGQWFRKVTNYRDPQVWRIEEFGGHNHYHRSLTDYVELLRLSGLCITRLFEPEWNPNPDSEMAYVVRQWPITLLIEAQRGV